MANKQFEVDKKCNLKRFPGKGGWTFAEIPEIEPDKHQSFGWTVVSGLIDHIPLQHVKLMPEGDGSLFLPVNAKMRKLLNKKAGDLIHIRLNKEQNPYVIPEVLIQCLKDDSSDTYLLFKGLSDHHQKAWLDWIFSIKNDKTRIDRIVRLIHCLERTISFQDHMSNPVVGYMPFKVYPIVYPIPVHRHFQIKSDFHSSSIFIP